MKENIQTILRKLDNIEFIKDLAKIIHDEVNGKISICFPRQKNRQDKIHFLIETEKETTLFKLNELEQQIADKIGYHYDNEYCENIEDEEDLVILNNILFKKEGINTLISDITPLSEENFVNIKKFLAKNYSKLFKTEEEKKGKTEKVQNILAYLQANKTIWNNIVAEPELLNEAKDQLKVQHQAQESTKETSTNLIYSM